MRDVRIDAKPANLSLLANPVISYFEELHSLIVDCEITNLTGSTMTLEQGADIALRMFERVRSRERKIMLIGNGGSAAVASHEALDFWNAGKIRATSFNDYAQLTCLSNDYGYENVYSKAVEMFADPGDTLIAISSSGRSVNILNAVEAARVKQCSVITFSGFEIDNPLRSVGDLNFYLKSTSYGQVEVGHLSLIHYLTDMVKMNRRG
ncbi:MAG: SIS domain-containing protein [Candidatus Obscuribacterales bacterium]|nr:SIS domain-containing protein [Candidatus Obscuribacterales bacterium]